VSAMPQAGAPRLQPMRVQHLDAVATIEAAAYPFPWSRGNFVDSLAAGYWAEVLLDERAQVLGYYVAMPVVDELHLLNITVAPALHGQGHGRRLLDRVVQQARATQAVALWLEVRESNQRAREIYQRYGFVQVGRRPAYYPAPGGREDALLMSLLLGAPGEGTSHGVD